MAELDYALLAEFARVDSSGLLTVVGGSFGRVHPQSFPAIVPLFVAMRVLTDEGEDEPAFGIQVTPPDDAYQVTVDGVVPRVENAVMIDGQTGVSVALGVTLHLAKPGLCHVRVSLNGEERRVLSFEVVDAATQV